MLTLQAPFLVGLRNLVSHIGDSQPAVGPTLSGPLRKEYLMMWFLAPQLRARQQSFT